MLTIGITNGQEAMLNRLHRTTMTADQHPRREPQPEQCIRFSETPASDDEIGIAKLITQFATALNAHDVTMLEATLAPDAIIGTTNRGGALLPREAYLAAMSKIIKSIRRVQYHRAVIRVSDDCQSATMFYSGSRQLYGRSGATNEMRYFRCKKYRGQWMIAEAGYLDP